MAIPASISSRRLEKWKLGIRVDALKGRLDEVSLGFGTVGYRHPADIAGRQAGFDMNICEIVFGRNGPDQIPICSSHGFVVLDPCGRVKFVWKGGMWEAERALQIGGDVQGSFRAA